MLRRREFLSLCACAACASLSYPSRAATPEEVLDAEFYLCDTPQITDVFREIQELANIGGQTSVGDFSFPPTSSLQTEIDLYATAQAGLRWTARTAGKVVSGIPVVPVGFVDGTPAQKQAVVTFANGWLQNGIPVAFEFVEDLSKAKVRISMQGGGNQSATGISSLSTKYGHGATMTLPEVARNANSVAARRAVLHEFGHAIMTFGHEHRHPSAGLKFKSPEIIAGIINTTMLAPGSKPWSADKVRLNITDPPYDATRACTAYDRESIMHYPVLSSWLVAGTPVPNPATSLSDLDVECARTVYGA